MRVPRVVGARVHVNCGHGVDVRAWVYPEHGCVSHACVCVCGGVV